MVTAHGHCSQPFLPEFRCNGRSAVQQEVDPDPRKTAESDFQATRPIDSPRIRILSVPMLPLRKKFGGKPRIVAEAIGLGQGHEMLMAVQFPGDLGITHGSKIQILNLEPQIAWSLLPVYKVQMPIDFPAAIQVLIAKQVEPMLANLLCTLVNRLNLVRHPLS